MKKSVLSAALFSWHCLLLLPMPNFKNRPGSSPGIPDPQVQLYRGISYLYHHLFNHLCDEHRVKNDTRVACHAVEENSKK